MRIVHCYALRRKFADFGKIEDLLTLYHHIYAMNYYIYWHLKWKKRISFAPLEICHTLRAASTWSTLEKDCLTRKNHKVNVLKTVKTGLGIAVLLKCVWDTCVTSHHVIIEATIIRRFGTERHTHAQHMAVFMSLAVRVMDRCCCDSSISDHA